MTVWIVSPLCPAARLRAEIKLLLDKAQVAARLGMQPENSVQAPVALACDAAQAWYRAPGRSPIWPNLAASVVKS